MALHQSHALLVLARVDAEAPRRALGLEQRIALLPLAQPLGTYPGPSSELANSEASGSIFHVQNLDGSIAPYGGRVPVRSLRIPQKGRIYMAETATDVREQAQEKAQQAQEKAQEVASKATDQARSQIDQRSTELGHRVTSTADDIRSVGQQLREQGKDQPARIVEQAAGHVERVGSWLRDSDSDRLLSDVEDFGRRQPWAFALGGLALGVAAARFLKASSTQRYEQRRQPQGFQGNGHTPSFADPASQRP